MSTEKLSKIKQIKPTINYHEFEDIIEHVKESIEKLKTEEDLEEYKVEVEKMLKSLTRSYEKEKTLIKKSKAVIVSIEGMSEKIKGLNNNNNNNKLSYENMLVEIERLNKLL